MLGQWYKVQAHVSINSSPLPNFFGRFDPTLETKYITEDIFGWQKASREQKFGSKRLNQYPSDFQSRSKKLIDIWLQTFILSFKNFHPEALPPQNFF